MTSKVLIGIVLVSALVPASYIGNIGAKWLFLDRHGNGGPGVAIAVVALAALVLGCVAGIAIAAAARWKRIFPVIMVGGILTLGILSIWMFTSLEGAREGLLVFSVTAVALSLIGIFIKIYEKVNPHKIVETGKKTTDGYHNTKNTDVPVQLTSDAHKREYPEGAAAPNIVPAIEDQPETFQPIKEIAVVYIYRHGMIGAAASMGVTVNGRYLGETTYNTYFRAAVNPGICKIISQEKPEKGLELNVEKEKIYFIWQQVKMGLVAGSKLNLVSETQGRAEIKLCRRLVGRSIVK